MTWEISYLGTLGGTSSQAWGIRADGSIVVGSSLNGSGSLQGFSWGGGTMTALGFLTGGTAAEARAISASGLIVGYSRDSSAIDQAVTWTGTAPSLIGNTLGGSGARALGVSTGGEVVGWARESSGVQRAFVFSSGAMSALNLTAINGQHDPNAGHSARALGVSPDGRYVVGEFEVDNGLGGAELHGFVYDRTSPASSYEFSSGGVGSARASNNTHADGQILNPPTDTLAAFSLHSGASASFLPSLSGDEVASAINTSGVIVGFQDLGAGRRATAWSGPSVSATSLNLDALHGQEIYWSRQPAWQKLQGSTPVGGHLAGRHMAFPRSSRSQGQWYSSYWEEPLWS